MRMLRLGDYTRKRKVTTTRPARNRNVFANLVKRNFTALKANTVLVGDITYLSGASGANIYLATVIDCYSRRLVGFAIADHMRTELVEEALEHDCRSRGSLAGAIFHSDHGSVYTSSQFQTTCRRLRTTCRRLQVTQSMGAVGTSADNSLANSLSKSCGAATQPNQPTHPSFTTATSASASLLPNTSTPQDLPHALRMPRHTPCKSTGPAPQCACLTRSMPGVQRSAFS